MHKDLKQVANVTHEVTLRNFASHIMQDAMLPPPFSMSSVDFRAKRMSVRSIVKVNFNIELEL